VTVTKFNTYRVFLAIATDCDYCSRYGWVIKVPDGNWRFVRIAGIDSEYIIAFTHSHSTVARHVSFVAWLGANVYLHNTGVVLYRQTGTSKNFRGKFTFMINSVCRSQLNSVKI